MSNIKYILKIALPLLVICSVTVAVLAAVNAFTAPLIAEHAENELNNSMNTFFGEDCQAEVLTLDGYDLTTNFTSGTVKRIYKVSVNGSDVGYCFDVTGKGAYKNSIEMLVAVNPDGTVKGISTVVSNETPSKSASVLNQEYYLKNYIGHDIFSINRGTDVTFISGSTRTSTALNNAVHTALLAFEAVSEPSIGGDVS